jgi:hypothetical protein
MTSWLGGFMTRTCSRVVAPNPRTRPSLVNDNIMAQLQLQSPALYRLPPELLLQIVGHLPAKLASDLVCQPHASRIDLLF